MRSATACATLLGTLLLLLLGCGTADDAAMERAADAAPPEAFAGTWNLLATDQDGESLTSILLTATTTREGWTATLEGRGPLPVRIREVGGDSVVAEVGPYQSVLRSPARVTMRLTPRVEGDRITGPFRASYRGVGADSVLVGLLTGTRLR